MFSTYVAASVKFGPAKARAPHLSPLMRMEGQTAKLIYSMLMSLDGVRLDLDWLEEWRFPSGVIIVRYAVRGGSR